MRMFSFFLIQVMESSNFGGLMSVAPGPPSESAGSEAESREDVDITLVLEGGACSVRLV